MKPKCPCCPEGYLNEQSYSESFYHEGCRITVHGLVKYHCDVCGKYPINPKQYKYNQRRILEAKNRLGDMDNLKKMSEVLVNKKEKD